MHDRKLEEPWEMGFGCFEEFYFDRLLDEAEKERTAWFKKCVRELWEYADKRPPPAPTEQ